MAIEELETKTQFKMTNRNLRQLSLFPPEKLATVNCVIVGMGALGRQVAIGLAAAEVPRLRLIDFDRVDDVNLGPQLWNVSDLGQLKVDAAANECIQKYPQVAIEKCNRAFDPNVDIEESESTVVFSCVDDIPPRRQIFLACRDRVGLYVDGRMSAEVSRVFSVNPSILSHKSGYLETLKDPGADEPCTAKSTGFTAYVTAGLMIQQFSLWMRGLPLINDFVLSLRTGDTNIVDY